MDVDFTSKQWEELVESDLDDGSPEGSMMSCLAKLAVLFRRGRNAKKCLPLSLSVVESIKDDVECLDAKFAPTLETLRCRIETKAENPTSKLLTKVFGPEAVRSLYLRVYSLGVATEILIALLLRALAENTALLEERLEQMSYNMIALADEAARCLPLGAMSMVPCI